MGGVSSIKAYVFVGLGVVAAALVGFMAGMNTMRRRTPVQAVEMVEGTRYVMS